MGGGWENRLVLVLAVPSGSSIHRCLFFVTQTLENRSSPNEIDASQADMQVVSWHLSSLAVLNCAGD